MSIVYRLYVYLYDCIRSVILAKQSMVEQQDFSFKFNFYKAKNLVIFEVGTSLCCLEFLAYVNLSDCEAS